MLLVIFIFLLPWWVTLFLAVLGLFIFSNFYEFLASSVIVYVISTTKETPFLNKSLLVYLFIILFYLLAQYIRHFVIFYNDKSNKI